MTLLYLDPFSGLAGDMLLGALLDLGVVDLAALRAGLAALPVDGYELRARRRASGALVGTDVQVVLDAPDTTHLAAPPGAGHGHDHHHDSGHGQGEGFRLPASGFRVGIESPHGPKPEARSPKPAGHGQGEGFRLQASGSGSSPHGPKPEARSPKPDGHGRSYRSIDRLLADCALAAPVKDRARAVFARLAAAEAQVHGTTLDAVHFHEVGARDALVDITGACWLLDALGAPELVCGPLPLGSGEVRCAHGVLPIPAPATLALLVGCPTRATAIAHELVTPTGAALAATLAARFGPLPAMTIARVGYGIGDADFGDRPNVLRAVLGEAEGGGDALLEGATNLDDMSLAGAELLLERLFAAGARDAWFAPVTMKKNRPGVVLSLLAPAGARAALEAVVFAETSTLGLRWHPVERRTLARRLDTVTVEGRAVRVKRSWDGGRERPFQLEHDDVAAYARATGCGYPEAQRRLLAAVAERLGTGAGDAAHAEDRS